MEILPILLIVVALLIGLAVGWLLRGKALGPMMAEKAELAGRLDLTTSQRNGAISELAVEKERVAQTAAAAQRLEVAQAALSQRLDAVQAEREAALRELAALQSDTQARAEAFEAQIAALKDAKEQLSAQFSEIGGKLLGEAQKTFLDRADQRFAQANEKSEAQLKTLLSPVETTLKRYEEGLQRVEKDRVGSYAELREAVSQVQLGQGQVRDETAKLVNALRAAPKTRGRWGEQQFKNLIETAGLSSFVDFSEEVSVTVEDGRLRPDFIIRLPGDQQMVVDVKCSLVAYLNAVDQVDPAIRDALCGPMPTRWGARLIGSSSTRRPISSSCMCRATISSPPRWKRTWICGNGPPRTGSSSAARRPSCRWRARWRGIGDRPSCRIRRGRSGSWARSSMSGWRRRRHHSRSWATGCMARWAIITPLSAALKAGCW